MSVARIPLALAAMTALVYGWRLDYSPIHLHYDEIFFALQGHSIQSTGRDLNGRLLPLYFQLESSMNWYQPAAVYWTALVLMVAPLSDAMVRLPTVMVGVANVVLMYFVARQLFKHTGWAVLAAVLLMLTPAHFIHSRLAMDYVYPLPFILGWLLCLLRYLEQPTNRRLFLAATCLGLGFFSYIAASALTPQYFVATLALLWFHGEFTKRAVVATAGFAWPFVALVIFLLAYPDVVSDLMRKYRLGTAAPSGLDPLQQLRESVNVRTVSDLLNMFHRFFSPGYLFVTGGSNLTNSTGQAGVFLLPIAVVLIAGVRRVLTTPEPIGLILLMGFVTAPIPALVLPDDYAIDRELALLPFAVLLATIGVQRIWQHPLRRSPKLLCAALAALIGIVAVGYAVVTMMSRGRISGSTVLLMAVAAGIFLVGAAMERDRTWQPLALALLLLVPLQFLQFRSDYYGAYRPRAAGWFGGNIRGAVEEVMRLDQADPAPELHLSTDIPYIRSYWRFYQLVHGREDLSSRTKVFDGANIDLGNVPPNSLLLAAANDPVVNALVQRGEIRQVSGAGDPSEAGDPVPQFTIYRR